MSKSARATASAARNRPAEDTAAPGRKASTGKRSTWYKPKDYAAFGADAAGASEEDAGPPVDLTGIEHMKEMADWLDEQKKGWARRFIQTMIMIGLERFEDFEFLDDSCYEDIKEDCMKRGAPEEEAQLVCDRLQKRKEKEAFDQERRDVLAGLYKDNVHLSVDEDELGGGIVNHEEEEPRGGGGGVYIVLGGKDGFHGERRPIAPPVPRPLSVETTPCSNCGILGASKKCSQCRVEVYCGESCFKVSMDGLAAPLG